MKTIVWGVAADSTGTVVHQSDQVKNLPGGGVRVERRRTVDREPASAYASVHPAPMPLRWRHGEQIGVIVALRRAHDRLYAIGETELEPNQLQTLANENDGLRMSAATNGPIGQPLRITEISLTPEPATVGLPAVSWWKLDVVKGNLPAWVAAELRASKTEHRSRRELRVHEIGESPIEHQWGGEGVEHRDPTPPIEIRHAVLSEVKFPQRIIEVVAVPYNQQAIVEYRGELWHESFERGSFAGIEKHPNRVPVNRQHDISDVVGKAVAFWPDHEEGLVSEIRIASTPRGDDTLTLASENMLSVSVGFGVPNSGQVLDRLTRRRRIKKAFLDHLSFVGAAAYEGAGVLAVRSLGQDAGDMSPVETPNLDEIVAWLESR